MAFVVFDTTVVVVDSVYVVVVAMLLLLLFCYWPVLSFCFFLCMMMVLQATHMRSR